MDDELQYYVEVSAEGDMIQIGAEHFHQAAAELAAAASANWEVTYYAKGDNTDHYVDETPFLLLQQKKSAPEA